MQLIPQIYSRFAECQVAYFKHCKNSEIPGHLSARFLNRSSSMLFSIAHNNGSYCGNKIVEEGEDCDCGRPEECLAVDKCCVARNDALNIPGCTVRQGKQCRCVLTRMYDVITSTLQTIVIIIVVVIIIIIINSCTI